MKMTDIRKMTISTVVSIDGKTDELDAKVFVYNKNVISDEDVIGLYHSGNVSNKVLTLTKEQASNLFYEETENKDNVPAPESKKRTRRTKAEMQAAKTQAAMPAPEPIPVAEDDVIEVSTTEDKEESEAVEEPDVESDTENSTEEDITEESDEPVSKPVQYGKTPEFVPVPKYKGLSTQEITALLKKKNRENKEG